MTARPMVNAMMCRRRIRGPDHVIDAREAVLRRVTFDLRGRANRINIAPQARLSNVTIRMEGEGHSLTIGRDVRIHTGRFAFFDDGCSIRIDERTTIYDASFGITEAGRISVGCDCLISFEVDIRNGDSHSIVDSATGKRINPAANVDIGDHVWLGARTMMLKGATIGANSVVGAASLVSGAIPANCVAAGVPARVVAEGTDWRRDRR